jgi:prepilin-type N-terminal cleavage/methylation domain-containing protein
MNKKGFTLIELVMVIVIIGILAAIAIPRFMNIRHDAQQAASDANVGAIRAAITNYYARTALTGTAAWPVSLHDTAFLEYLQGATLPKEPGNPSFDYNSLYNNTSGVMNTHIVP